VTVDFKKIGIVAFAFGPPDSIEPNQTLSIITTKKARELNARVYAQKDIKITAKGVKVDYVKQNNKKALSTLQVAEKTVEWIKKNNITNLYVMAAKPHLWRCKRDIGEILEREKINITIHTCFELIFKENWFYDIRDEKEWIKREKIIKKMPFWLYSLLNKLKGPPS